MRGDAFLLCSKEGWPRCADMYRVTLLRVFCIPEGCDYIAAMMFRNRKGTSAAPTTFDAPLRPDVPFFAVGDVHGCDALLDTLLKRLDAEQHPEALLVMMGDYVDRGEDTSRTLRRLHYLSNAAGDLMHCIMGNHEKMLLDVIDDPAHHGPRWLRHGGLQTLASYRVAPVLGERPDGDWIAMRDKLATAIGADTINWLRELPLFWRSGNVFAVHAGADPALPVDEQDRGNLLWGHPDFRKTGRADGQWIVHGHTITESPKVVEGRIPTDTGAYATGVLSAALVETDSVTYFHT